MFKIILKVILFIIKLIAIIALWPWILLALFYREETEEERKSKIEFWEEKRRKARMNYKSWWSDD